MTNIRRVASAAINTLTVLTATFLTTVALGAIQRPAHDGKTIMFGNLHAHSKLSDDVTNAGDDMLPIVAFRYAHQHGLDFLAISDHQKADDSPHSLGMQPAEYKSKLYDVALSYSATNEDGFVAIPAIEWGNTATGNHLNLIGLRQLPPDSIQDQDYDEIYGWGKDHAEFLIFNHPNSWRGKPNRNQRVGNFGENLFPTTTAFLAKAGVTVRTVSIITSVAGGHITGKFKHSTDKTHRDEQWENYYKQYLNKGFHISPSADQDTHWKNWGTVTAARTAVWAAKATYAELMKAFQANRVYATEDDELVVAYQARVGNKTYWMGDTISLSSSEADVDLVVKIWQGTGSDGDATDEGPYTVELVSDSDGVGGHEAAIEFTQAHIASGQSVTIPHRAVAGGYVYLRITEEHGKDNPVGDGVDEFNNATGAAQSDGKRDDLNDSAWTSPIWFSGGVDVFVWSAAPSAKVYHDASCWAAKRIGEANRRSGPQPPTDRSKHDCRE
jgi:hypothetical protein